MLQIEYLTLTILHQCNKPLMLNNYAKIRALRRQMTNDNKARNIIISGVDTLLFVIT